MVCLGNICRSPMAHVVLADRIAAAGLGDPRRVEVVSCGTGDWHVGDPMDPRAASTLRDAGYDPSSHRARHFDDGWLAECDVLFAMDEQNLADIGGRSDRVMLFRDLDPTEPGGIVPDPYYGGEDGFTEVLAMVERTSDAIVAALPAALGRD